MILKGIRKRTSFPIFSHNYCRFVVSAAAPAKDAVSAARERQEPIAQKIKKERISYRETPSIIPLSPPLSPQSRKTNVNITSKLPPLHQQNPMDISTKIENSDQLL